jgi:CHAD domain-containing protein
MIDRLHRRSDGVIDAAGKERLTRELKVRRQAGQRRMNKALDLVDQEVLDRQLTKLQDKIRWRGVGKEPDWKSATTTMLQQNAAGLIEVGRPLEGQGKLQDHIEELHQLRIRGKQLRYAMEIAVGAFGKPLRELYGFIEQTQEILGIINDHAVAHDFYLASYDRESDPHIGETLLAVAAIERSGLEASLLQFPQWWNSQRVGQFWIDWQKVVGPLPDEALQNAEDDASLDDTSAQRKGV